MKIIEFEIKGVKMTCLYSGNIYTTGELLQKQPKSYRLTEAFLFHKQLDKFQIEVVLNNIELFNFSTVKIEEAKVVGFPKNLIAHTMSDVLHFVCNDPGDDSVGIWPCITEVMISISPVYGSDVEEFWKKCVADFCDVSEKNVFTKTEFLKLSQEID